MSCSRIRTKTGELTVRDVSFFSAWADILQTALIFLCVMWKTQFFPWCFKRWLRRQLNILLFHISEPSSTDGCYRDSNCDMIWIWQVNLNRTGFLLSVITLEYFVALGRELELVETIVFQERRLGHHILYTDTCNFLMYCRQYVVLKPLQIRDGFEATMQYSTPCENVKGLTLNLVFWTLSGEAGEGCSSRGWGKTVCL